MLEYYSIGCSRHNMLTNLHCLETHLLLTLLRRFQIPPPLFLFTVMEDHHLLSPLPSLVHPAAVLVLDPEDEDDDAGDGEEGGNDAHEDAQDGGELQGHGGFW